MDLADLDPNPLLQFQAWYAVAQKVSGMEFPDAMALATADARGRPSLRMVLFKGLKGDTFTFVSNYESRKGSELAANPQAALCFFWDWTGHQVRVEGAVEKMSAADSDAYFRGRERASQLGAWASPQSHAVESRAALEASLAEVDARFSGQHVPRPPNWGGYCLRPERLEFWKSVAHRLHDRFEYTRAGNAWAIQRLAP